MKRHHGQNPPTIPDIHGKPHKVDATELIDRLSVYGVCIIAGKVLLIQDPRTMRWELPGGGVEKHETIRQGLVREFKEETNVTPGPATFLTEWQENFYDLTSHQAWRAQRKFYLITTIDHPAHLLQTSNGDDSNKAAFLPLDELSGLQLSDAARRVIALAVVFHTID
jgi:8-oxo-dGTP diphosphatase